MLQKEQNQNGFKEKFAAVLIFISILIVFAVIKNVSPAVSSSGDQFNKAGITFPSSIFVGEKELTGIEIDTVKSVRGKRSFSYFQKEDGKMKRYRAKMKDGKLTDLSIDGEKVPQEKLDSYREDVEEAYNKLDNDDNFFVQNLFPKGGWFPDSLKNLTEEITKSFNSKEFHDEMAKLSREIAASATKWTEQFKSEEFQEQMKELRREMKENSSEWKKQFNSADSKRIQAEVKKQMEKIRKDLKEHKYDSDACFDSEEFAKQMEKMGEEISRNVEKMNLKNLESLKNLEALQSLRHMKNFDSFNDVAMKGFNNGMKDFNIKMKGFSEKMKVFGEKMKVFGKFMKEVKEMLVDEKLIEEDDDNVNMNFKKDGIYIDGKKQSEAAFEKFKKIYRKYYNKEFDGEFHLGIDE